MGKKTVQHVMIKGSKQGLMIVIDDTSSFSEAMRDLDEKLSIHHQHLANNEPASSINVTIHTGNRYLTDEQATHLVELVEKKGYMTVKGVESNVILLEESKRMAEEVAVTKEMKIVRSGQVLEVKGDLLLVGDVNPGGTVKAGGNIFVLGTLRGRAEAGIYGNKDCVISASVFKPALITIGDILCNSFDHHEQEDRVMACAYVDQTNEIMFDRLQVLSKVRPNISLFEEGV
jgi:septum site-determining protein MinC